MPDQAWQFIYPRTKKVVQRPKDNSSFTFDAKFGNSRLQAAFGEFFKSFLRLPYLNDAETGFSGVGNMLVYSGFRAGFYTHLIQYRAEFFVG